jgi:hypothetical protein
MSAVVFDVLFWSVAVLAPCSDSGACIGRRYLMPNPDMRVASIVALILFTASAAEAASVREVFERYGLLGTFAVDCRRPVSPENHYTIFRALDAGRVQIDLMVGPRQRQYAYVIDRAEARGSNIIAISMANEQQRLNLVYRVEGKRLRTMESARAAGPTIVAGGVFTANRMPTPWIIKCRAGGRWASDHRGLDSATSGAVTRV